jgi:hypothetical protein
MDTIKRFKDFPEVGTAVIHATGGNHLRPSAVAEAFRVTGSPILQTCTLGCLDAPDYISAGSFIAPCAQIPIPSSANRSSRF